MQYSNGYNITSVLPALFGRLAWSTGSGLNTANTTSASGRRFDDGSFHSAVSVDNIKAVNPDPVTPATWDSFFTARQNAVILKALNRVFGNSGFQEQMMAYSPYNEQTILETNAGKAVGFKIEIAKAFDMAYQVNKLELYFNAATTFNVYLFKLGSLAPIKTKSVTTVADQKTVIPLTDWFLSPTEAGTYYIVYFQNDISGSGTQAIKENTTRCRANYFKAESFIASTTGTYFNRVNDISYYPSSSSGLNVQISSFKDYSHNTINQPHLFDQLVGLENAYNTIEEILYSTESNGKERILKGAITEIGLQLDLKGTAAMSHGPETEGLLQLIQKEVADIKECFYPKQKAQTVNVNC